MLLSKHAGAVLFVFTLTGTACEHKDAASVEPAAAAAIAEQPAAPSAGEASGAAPAQNAAANTAGAATVWPDGWILLSEEEWIPVLDDVGNDLIKARTAFAKGDRKAAAQDVRGAVSSLEKRKEGLSPDALGRLAQVSSDLGALAARLEGTDAIPQTDLDRALGSAYRSVADVEWVYLREDIWVPTFERPAEHFQRALALLDQGQGATAADEIQRGAGYFRLAMTSARSDDRELLQAQVDKLSSLAKQADAGTLKSADLKQALAQVDNAYAESYLHQAEAEWSKKESSGTRRALREASARIRSGASWLGAESKDATHALVEDLEKLGHKLGAGAKITSEELHKLIEKASASLHAAPKSPQGK
jgi:hypothetical protein